MTVRRIIFSTILFLSSSAMFFSCSEKRNPEFQNISFNETSREVYANLELPQFDDANLSELNDLLMNQKNDFQKIVADYEQIWNEWNDANLTFDEESNIPLQQFSYNQTYQVFYSKNLISILFSIETYVGGPHGNLQYLSFCYDTKAKKLRTIEEVSGMSSQAISNTCIGILLDTIYKDTSDTDIDAWVNSGAGIDAVNKMNFTVDNGKVTVHFAPYEVASYAEGPIAIAIN